MIPESLKLLLQPWLKKIDAEPLIEYIRQQTLVDLTELSEVSDDLPTVRLSESERSGDLPISSRSSEEDSLVEFDVLESMHFHESPP